jgi:hypothetical protein
MTEFMSLRLRAIHSSPGVPLSEGRAWQSVNDLPAHRQSDFDVSTHSATRFAFGLSGCFDARIAVDSTSHVISAFVAAAIRRERGVPDRCPICKSCATAIVQGKVVRFQVSPSLARAHRKNRDRPMIETGAVAFGEAKHCASALRRARAWRSSS